MVNSDRFAGVERSIVLSSIAVSELGHHVTALGGDPSVMPALFVGSSVTWRPASSLGSVAAALFRERRADIVHAHMTDAESVAALLLPMTDARLVVTRHFALRRGLGRLGPVARRVVERVPRTEIAISQYVADTIECESTVVPHGMPDADQVPASGRIAVIVQRLEAEKSTDVALRAWQRSKLATKGWRLRIAGDGAERTSLERLAKDLGIADSVEFLGAVADVDTLRRSATLQIATPPGEHFGLSVLEAMACGLPVLASKSGAHPELLGARPEDEVFSFGDGDADGLARSLAFAAAEPERLASYGRRLRTRQQAEFSLSAHAKRLEDLYRTALAQPPRRPAMQAAVVR